MIKQLSVLLLFLSFSLVAKTLQLGDHKEAFQVLVLERKVKVISPLKESSKTSVVIENRTLSKLLGKIELDNGKNLGFLSIPSNGFRSLEFSVPKGRRFFFVPMSPPFQKIELIFGQRSYEIPPKI